MQPVPCVVKGVFIITNGAATAPAVVLSDARGRQMPIFIGLWEAVSINSAKNRELAPRPLTHDLFIDLAGRFGITINELRIDSETDGVYYAQLALSCRGKEEYIDCRPSDGIAIVLRAGAPIVADEALLIAAAEESAAAEEMVELSSFLQEQVR